MGSVKWPGRGGGHGRRWSEVLWRSGEERPWGVHGAEASAGCPEGGVPWPLVWPQHPGLAIPGPEHGRCVEEAASQFFGVGVFEFGAGEEIELKPSTERVGPADHRGPHFVAGGVLTGTALRSLSR